MENKNDGEIIILPKDNTWSVVENQVCRVLSYIPAASVQNNKAIRHVAKLLPYCELTFQCGSQIYRGYITIETDFINLWQAFKEKKTDEEVLFIWTRTHYTNPLFYMSKLHKFFAYGLPKLYIMLCHKGTYEHWSPSWMVLKQEWEEEHRRTLLSVISGMGSAIKVWRPDVMDDISAKGF